MLLLPVVTGLLLVLPGLESSIHRIPNGREYDPDRLDSVIDRLIERYQRRLEEDKRRTGQQNNNIKNDQDVNIPEAKNPELNQPEPKDVGEINFAENEVEEEDISQDSGNKELKDKKNDTDNRPISHSPNPPQAHRQDPSQSSVTGLVKNDFMFIFIVAACSIAGLVGLIMAGVCWYKLHTHVKAASDVDYPAYGVTGPTKERSPSQGDRKLAQSAQMYHYQHQKQQMIAMEKANGEMKPDASDEESEEENEEGDYTVYECPGLAPTGEMEVRNPLFTEDAQTPVNGQSTVVNGVPEDKKE